MLVCLVWCSVVLEVVLLLVVVVEYCSWGSGVRRNSRGGCKSLW